MDKQLIITDEGIVNNIRLTLTLITGVTKLLKEKAMRIEEAETLLFSPYSAKCLEALGIDCSIIDLIREGCELEDFVSLIPEKLDDAIKNMLNKSISIAKALPKKSPQQNKKWINNPSDMNKYLPIGSVVLLEQVDKKIMIYSRRYCDAVSNKIYDYVGCFYPEGGIGKEYTMLFNHDRIIKVVSLGYNDETNVEFSKKLFAKEQILINKKDIKSTEDAIMIDSINCYCNPCSFKDMIKCLVKKTGFGDKYVYFRFWDDLDVYDREYFYSDSFEGVEVVFLGNSKIFKLHELYNYINIASRKYLELYPDEKEEISNILNETQ